MKSKKRLTIHDLQKATGLSLATISRAFNESREISAKTRAMILRKAEEIGYSPHPGARTLKLGRTGRWGLLIPHLRNPWYAELTEAFDYEARQRRSMLMLGLSHSDADLERAFLQTWMRGEADGIIVTSTDNEKNYEEMLKIQAQGYPMVFLYGSPKNAFDYVTSETYENTLRVLRHFYELGHRKIGYISLKFTHDRQTQEFTAYRDFLREVKLPLEEDLMYFDYHDYEAGAMAWKKWRGSQQIPTAVFCKGDVIACDLMKAVRQSGLQVPRDLSLVGQGDTTEADRVGLTSIRTSQAELASAVFELLVRPRGDDQPKKMARGVPSELIMRDSVCAPARSGG
jgi:LacI family transcriptional regulator